MRCVKPNDVKMKIIDGAIAFDDYKTYRQLLYVRLAPERTRARTRLLTATRAATPELFREAC